MRQRWTSSWLLGAHDLYGGVWWCLAAVVTRWLLGAPAAVYGPDRVQRACGWRSDWWCMTLYITVVYCMEGAMYYNSVMKLCNVQDGGAGHSPI